MEFTIEDITTAHQKVKSGADFPQYIQTIKSLGVSHYTTYVSDGNTRYFNRDHQSVYTGSKYDPLIISEKTNLDHFKTRLKLHQQGGTDYYTFCNDCAENGIEGWVMNLETMTCSYFDKEQEEVLVEKIPA